MKITEQTFIPISLVIVVVGGAAWLTNLYAKTSDVEETVIELKTEHKEFQKKIYDEAIEINKRLSRIEGKLEKLKE